MAQDRNIVERIESSTIEVVQDRPSFRWFSKIAIHELRRRFVASLIAKQDTVPILAAPVPKAYLIYIDSAYKTTVEADSIYLYHFVVLSFQQIRGEPHFM